MAKTTCFAVIRITKTLLLFIGWFITAVAAADSTVEQLLDQEPNPNNKPSSEDTLRVEAASELQNLFKDYADLDRHFRLMGEPDSDKAVEQSLNRLKRKSGTADSVMALYRTLESRGNADNGYFGEARWRALHLLGELRTPQAASMLMAVAAEPMPDARKLREPQYKSEYRLRARAVDGLEKLQNTELLRKLYDNQPDVRGLAAAALFELGEPPKGVVKLDGRKVIGYGDPRDFNESRSPSAHGDSPATEFPRRGKNTDNVTPRTLETN